LCETTEYGRRDTTDKTRDKFRWKIRKKAEFSVRFFYLQLMTIALVDYRHVWQLKNILEIKINLVGDA
jgi:hypothetical protein